MPPRKRKADSSAGGDDGSPTPKKSKKEQLAEARAKAKAWHDARNGKASSTPATKSTSAASPSFSAGKSSTKKSSTPSKSPAASATKRRRTPSRKSTGGISTRTSERKETPSKKRGRRSMAASTSTGFEFNPPEKEEEEEEEEPSGSESDTLYPKKSPAKYEFGSAAENESSDGEEEEKKPASKKKKDEGKAAIRALREKRESSGFKVTHAATTADQRKSPPKMNSPDPPAFAAANTLRSTATTARMNSPDPPASMSASSSFAATNPSATAAAASTKRAFTAVAKSKQPPPVSKHATSKQPPASVASIFSAPKSKYSSSHRPYKQTFDPNKPFPPGGYKLPTAAYCGCGPTPGSNTSSLRGGVSGGVGGTVGAPGTNDVCMINSNNDPVVRNNNGSFTLGTGAYTVRENMQLASTRVDPPYQHRYLGGSEEDERKVAASRPSPPGRNANNGGEANAIVPASAAAAVATATNNAPAALAATPPPARNPSLLTAAMSRARALVSSAAAGNQQRREMMGIRSGGNNHQHQNVPSGGQMEENNGVQVEKVGLPPRNVVMMTEQQMDAANAELDGEEESTKSPVDPPMVDSASIPYASTLQKFREGNVTNTLEGDSIKQESPERAVAATTVAGEHTSEAGENNEEVKPPATASSAKEEEATDSSEEDKRPSFLKRACLSTFKLFMFFQMAWGIHYLATNYTKDYIPTFNHQGEEQSNTEEITVPEVETKQSCFLDNPAWDEDGNLIGMNKTDDEDDHHLKECEGNYIQCPQWGRCHKGKLQDCADEGGELFQGILTHRFIPNENKDGCEVSLEAREMIQVVQDTLMDMTTAQTCRLPDRVKEAEDFVLFGGSEGQDTYFPLFRLEKVADKMRERSSSSSESESSLKSTMLSSEFLLWLEPAFDSNTVRFGSLSGDGSDDLNAVGLGPNVSPNSLPLSMGCTMKLLLWELFEYFYASVWVMLAFLFKNTWFYVRNYPIYAALAVGAWKSAVYIRDRNKHRTKVRELFEHVLNNAYDRLAECDDHEGYAALILRDDVGFDMYPTSFNQRQWMNQNVWPRVTLEIRADNRVRKFRKVTNGKELEHWDFAIQSKKGRRIRRSIGTPGSTGTPGSGRKNGEVKDGMSIKRDP